MLILALIACRVSDPLPAPAGPPSPPPAANALPAEAPSAPGAGGAAPRNAPRTDEAPEPGVPTTVPVDGPCETTTLREIGTRLVDGDGAPVPGSGVALVLGNGLTLVDYETPALVASQKPGDRVEVCLVAVPTGCPPGDTRGKVYRVRDLRLGPSYTLPDASHMCGGA